MTSIDETGRDRGASADPAKVVVSAIKEKRSAAASGAGSPSLSGAASPSLEKRVTSLSKALARARVENAEQSAALSELRGAEIARLEILREQLEPVVAQLPRDCDLFDIAISPGGRPRLFIDQIGFVEMGRDRRNYSFLQDTRHGRISICESDKLDTLVDAITAYIAHRLVEREKALSVDYASGSATPAAAARAAAQSAGLGPRRATVSLRAMQVFLFLIELLGSATFFGLVGLLAVWLYRNMQGH